MGLFDFGPWFGYILWWFFNLTNNYAFAIVLFALVLKLAMFPLSIKRQKASASNARIESKKQELQKKYKNDKRKLSEETAKLYEKEQISMFGGCLPMLLPLFFVFAIYAAVNNPLTNMMHLPSGKVDEALKVLAEIPGYENSGWYKQINVIKIFGDHLPQFSMFSGSEVANILNLSKGFGLFGLDLLSVPSSHYSLWIIPVLCYVSQVITAWFSQKLQPAAAPMPGQAGCMKYVGILILPLMSAWISVGIPAAVGFYWIINGLLSFIETVIISKFYNVNILNAKQEAARVARRVLEESTVASV